MLDICVSQRSAILISRSMISREEPQVVKQDVANPVNSPLLKHSSMARNPLQTWRCAARSEAEIDFDARSLFFA